MSALLTLLFLLAVACLPAKAEEKGHFHGGGCPAAGKGGTKSPDMAP